MNRSVLIAFGLMAVGLPVLAQGRTEGGRPVLVVERFQVESVRIRKGMGRLTCRIRSRSWQPLENVRVTLRLLTEDGSVETFSLGTVPSIPPGRVVRVSKRVKQVPESVRYRVELTQNKNGGVRKWTYEGKEEKKRPELVSRETRSSGEGQNSADSGGGFPKKLDLNANVPFEGTNDVEAGHFTFWRTGEEELLVQGGIRNGRDHALTQLTISFVFKPSGGGSTKHEVEVNKTLKSGQIYPLSTRIEGIEEFDRYSIRFKFKEDPSQTETKNMTWEDVKDQLSPPEKQERKKDTGNTGNRPPEFPLLSLHGIRVIRSEGNNRKNISEVYLLKVRLTSHSSDVKPSGDIAYTVFEGDTTRLEQKHALNQERIQPRPEKFDPRSITPGTGYWDDRKKMLYVALFKVVDIHSNIRLRVRVSIDNGGTWTFRDLTDPYKNSPIPPDRVREAY